MTSRPVHAAKPGLAGDHRTDTLRCPCDPWQLIDLNEPSRIVVVHRPFDEDVQRRRAPFHPPRLP